MHDRLHRWLEGLLGLWSSTFENARCRAGRGAALLDRETPGWATRMDAGALHMLFNCPVQQVYGSYLTGMTVLMQATGAQDRFALAYRHGFTPGLWEGPGLVAAWRDEVGRRL